MRWGRLWFGGLLRLFPAEFLRRHGADMRDAIDDALAEERTRGRVRLLAFLFRTSLDLLWSGMRERLAPSGYGSAPAYAGAASRTGALTSWLDVKLGLRMLLKHPGLTLVSTLALAVGIPVGLAPAHFVDGIMRPLPVPQGEDIRSLRMWSPAIGRAANTTYHDFDTWRPALASFEGLGAFRETTFTLDAHDQGGSQVRGALVSASTFPLLRVGPLLGRALQVADERPGAENVVVLGYDVWQSRYAGDPEVVGRSVRLGSTPHTVVGVMPEGFHFPERQSVWTPLRVTADDQLRSAVDVEIFGRLADGVDDPQARAEFALVAGRSALVDEDLRLQPQVEEYAYIVAPGLNGGIRGTPEFVAFQGLALLVLLVACVNVGMLVFARTATRAGELAVRTALGASRARIVAQVFTECLVLAVLASGIGLLFMGSVLSLMWRVVPSGFAAALPYWIDWSVTGETVVLALGLAAVSAVVAGVVPAWRFTGAAVQANIQRARAKRTGVRFGGLPGILIVLDVAVAVSAVGFAVEAMNMVTRTTVTEASVGIPAHEYLAATLRLSAGAEGPGEAAARWDAQRERMASTQEELVRRLRAEPGVRAVAVADYLPRMEHRTRVVEAEGVEPPEGRRGVSSRVARVDLDFFDELEAPIVAGRGFDVGDLASEASAVIVNTSFVENVLGGQNAVGRRIRFRPWGDGEPGPWREIVGVVGHLGMRAISPVSDQGVYEVVAPGDLAHVRLGIRVGSKPEDFVPRLRALAGEVDADAIVSIIGPLDEVYEGDWYLILAASLGAGLLVGVLLALAASGIYAIMSFAVEERATEIGIRAALGSGRYRLVRSVTLRALVQLAVGVALGMPVAGILLASGGNSVTRGAVGTLALGVAVLVFVGLVACTGPTLRALRIHPSEALRSE